MFDLSHLQLLLILAICLIPVAVQLVINEAVHWLWTSVALAAAIFAVVAW